MLGIYEGCSTYKQPYVGNRCTGFMGLMASACIEVPRKGTLIVYSFVLLSFCLIGFDTNRAVSTSATDSSRQCGVGLARSGRTHSHHSLIVAYALAFISFCVIDDSPHHGNDHLTSLWSQYVVV